MTSLHKHLEIALWATLVLGTLLAFSSNVSAGEYVRVSPDLELYYEEAGTVYEALRGRLKTPLPDCRKRLILKGSCPCLEAFKK